MLISKNKNEKYQANNIERWLVPKNRKQTTINAFSENPDGIGFDGGIDRPEKRREHQRRRMSFRYIKKTRIVSASPSVVRNWILSITHVVAYHIARHSRYRQNVVPQSWHR